MYQSSDIRVVEIETTNKCNAACPQCMRTNEDSLKPTDFNHTLDWKQLKISPKFWAQLDRINFNGTSGDNIMHPMIADIVDEVAAAARSDCQIRVCTNGSLRNQQWWQSFGKMCSKYPNVTVVFGIDGLEDTHHLYRVGTDFQKVIKNAQAFIQVGGRAEWQMILFQHNLHQIEQCRALSQDLGFSSFVLRSENRFHAGTDTHKVYWRGKETHTITYPGRDTINELTAHNDVVNDWSQALRKPESGKKIRCRSQETGWCAIYADGTLWPCCWTMGWIQSTHLSQQKIVKYHYDKILGIDLSQISLYNNKIEDIINSDLWQSRWPSSFDSAPNPVCIQQCSR